MTRRLIAIVGATATGKTSLGIELALRSDGEIVGADSRQVYRHMDVGTAKPSAEERSRVRHHLVDVADPDEPFSLGRWLELAQAALEDIWSRGKQPLLAGGTGQYVWALLEGWRVPRVAPQRELRARLEARPAEALVEELRRVDPQAAASIDGRNVRRVVRALEVHAATGKPLTFWRTKEPPAFESLVLGLRLPREELYGRIDGRVEEMVEQGLVEEVRSLLEMGYGRELPSMSGIGYAEIASYLAGEIDLPTAVARIKTGTHRLARHQNSWFKESDRRIRWIAASAGVVEEAARLVGEFLGLRGQTPAAGRGR